MRTSLRLCILLVFTIFSSFISFAQTCNLAGTYTIGAGANYPSITAAVAALRTNGMGNHVILELQANYTSVSETLPLTFHNIPCIANDRTVTIRPAANATNLIISSNSSTNPTIDLNNARYIRFDGRPGGAGTARQLTIVNNNTTVIRLINDASYNSFSYLNVQGGGIRLLTSNQSVTNGNSNNTIEQCAVFGGVSGGVASTIYSKGTAGKKNTHNKVLNNLIYNYLGAGGVQCLENTGPWQISGNHFYYTLQAGSGNVIGINIDDSTSSGFEVHDNFIGGMAPSCGGTPNTYNSFTGIKIRVGADSYSSIQGNTIGNTIVRAVGGSGGNFFHGIFMQQGKFKCGDVTGNTIGSQTQTGNITIRGETDFVAYGIVAGTYNYESGTDTCYIMNNKIGGMYGYQADFNFVQTNFVVGIYILDQKKGYCDISNNFIGSPSTPNSLWNTKSLEPNTFGIYCANKYNYPPCDNLISNNEIAQLVGETKGIYTAGGRNRIINNKIHHLYGIDTNNGDDLWPRGIAAYGPATGTVISGNIIHSLTWTGQSGEIYGIHVRDARGILIEKNFIHSFQALTTQSIATIYGINFYEGRGHNIQNNMIRLGIDTAGVSTNFNTNIQGISIKLDSSTILNNSIWIGGTSNQESAALNALVGNANGSKIRNNIFVNTRSAQGTAYFNHYALKYNSSSIGTNVLDYNIYHATGVNGYLGYFIANQFDLTKNNFTNIIDWRNTIKLDSHSVFYNPNFINPAGNAATVNLHLANANPAEGQGIAETGVTEDIDNESRSSFSPVDIGADAGNFTLQDGDAPRIAHQVFLGNPVISSFIYKVNITDNGSGIDTTGNNKPRMWFRKKYPTTGNWTSLPGQFISGNLNNGTWGFPADFAGAGVPVAAGDSLEYYFVAQDKGTAFNTGYSNVQGTKHTNVNVQTTPPANPLRLLIYGIFPDTVYVGTGQLFTSLTNNGGFFQAAQTNMFDTTVSHPTVIITSDLSETGIHYYKNINESGAVITFTTNTPVVKHISNQGDMEQATLNMNTMNVAIDGSVNGSGRYLHINNGHISPQNTKPALLIGGRKNLTIRNVIFSSNGITSTGESLNLGAGSFDTLLVEGNLFTNIESSPTPTTGLPNSSVYCSMGKTSSKIIIRKNEFTNFKQAGITVRQSINEAAGELLLDSNHFYYNSAIAPVNGVTAIDAQLFTKATISNNYIGGSQPYCGGTPWTYSQAPVGSTLFNGIAVGTYQNIVASVQGNMIRNIRFTSPGYLLRGIYAVDGSLNIGTEQGNRIGSLNPDSTIITKGGLVGIYGYIAIYKSDTPTVRIENNIVEGMSASSFTGIDFETRRATISNNVIQHITTSNAGYRGMRIWVGRGRIEGNRVLNLTSLQTTSIENLYGMDLAQNAQILPADLVVARNKVAGLRSYWSGGSYPQVMVGIRMQFGPYELQNNQVDLNNGNLPNPVDIRGIQVENSGSPQNSIYYNTVRLSGSTTSNGNTYAVLVNNGSGIKNFRNNMLYNERTGGTGRHLALGDVSTSTNGLQPAACDNNLYVVNDTSFVNEYRTSGVVNLSNWRNLVKGDSVSYVSTVADLPAASLFANAAQSDLNINTASRQSWYVNGKGRPVETISGDFDAASGVRSVSIATGATDIGADEFNTTTAPPALLLAGTHAPGGTETFSMNGRTIASITWGNTGTLSNLDEAYFYSGVWPNDTTNNGTAHFARFMNAFWHIPATGGSNYSYSITFYYDSSILGKVTDASSMIINKKQSGINGSWTVIQPTIVDTALQTITIHNQTSFSEFTATDANATLVSGVPSPDLVITQAGINSASAATGSTITVNFTEYNQGFAASKANKVHFYLSADNLLTPGDTLLGSYDVPAALNINTGTGALTKDLVIPCNMAAGNYTLFFVADGTGLVQETDEDNNTVSAALAVSIGLTVPATPVITGAPGFTVCSPGTITLTANSSGCTSCTYNWNTGATGNNITVNATGTYTVTAANSCGQTAASQLVTVKAAPVVSASANVTYTCVGSQVKLSASGADTYIWSGSDLNTTSGSSVIAQPSIVGGYIYQVIGTRNGCSNTAQIALSVNPTVTPSVKIDYTGCPSNTLTFTATPTHGGDHPKYNWQVNNMVTVTGNVFTLNNATNGTVVSVELVSNRFCANPGTATASVTINCIPTAVSDIDGLEKYSLSPNPSTGLFEIKMTFNVVKKVAIQLTDVNGRTVYQVAPFTAAGTVSKQINIRHLPAGIYYMRVRVNNQSFTDKLFKTN